MAKKLTPEQQLAFTEACRHEEERLLDATDAELIRNLAEKRDEVLLMSPELRAYFDKEFPEFYRLP